jgi:hypothetical protein
MTAPAVQLNICTKLFTFNGNQKFRKIPDSPINQREMYADVDYSPRPKKLQKARPLTTPKIVITPPEEEEEEVAKSSGCMVRLKDVVAKTFLSRKAKLEDPEEARLAEDLEKLEGKGGIGEKETLKLKTIEKEKENERVEVRGAMMFNATYWYL